MNEHAITPDWVPSDWKVENLRSKKIELQQLGREDARFGVIPKGWHVTLKGNLNRRLRISAEKVSGDVRIEVLNSKNIEIPRVFFNAIVHGHPRYETRIKISRKRFFITIGAGEFDISSEEEGCACAISVEPEAQSSRKSNTVLRGSARIFRLKGQGKIECFSKLSKNAVVKDLSGALTIHQHVKAVDIDSKKLHLVVVKGASSGSRLNVEECELREKIDNCTVHAKRIIARKAIERSKIYCRSQVVLHHGAVESSFHLEGSEDEVALISATSFTQKGSAGSDDGILRISDGRISFPYQLNNPAKLENCDIRSNGKPSMLVGPCFNTSITGFKHVAIEGPVHVNDPDYRVEMSCTALFVTGNVTGGGQLFVNVSGPARLNGSIDGGHFTCHEDIQVGSSLKGSFLKGSALKVEGGVQDCVLNASNSLHLHKMCSSDTSITLRGSGVFEGDIEGSIIWGAEDAGNLRFECKTIGRLQVESELRPISDDLPTIQLGGEMRQILGLKFCGSLSINCDKAVDNQSGSIVVEELCCDEASSDCARLRFSGERSLVLESVVGANAFFLSHMMDNQSNALVIRDVQGSKIGICSTSQVRFPDIPRESDVSTVTVCLYAAGPFEIDRHFDRVECAFDSKKRILNGDIGSHARAPVLHVTNKGSISEVKGQFSVHEIEGRISGIGYSNLMNVISSLRRNEKEACAQLIGFEKSSHQGEGQIENIDPTALPYSQIEDLCNLHVFHPDPGSMMRHANDFNGGSFDVKAQAQRAQRLAESVIGRAVAGSSRSAAIWMALRLHHKSLALTKVEWWLRWFHRGFGYSQRPGPAALSWLATVVAWSLLPWCSAPAGDLEGACRPMGFLERFMTMLLLPGALLRLPSPEAPILFGWASWYIVAFVVIGVPLVYFIISLKNFLSSPLARK